MVINQFVKFVLIKKVEKMNEDERIKIFWLETCGTGNTMTLSTVCTPRQFNGGRVNEYG